MKSLLSPCVFGFSTFSFCDAQEAISFKMQKAFYINGEAMAIGNKILSKDARKPYNDNVLANDDIDMVYIDIDDDNKTFYLVFVFSIT
ncbi:hypothetical protein [Olleya sp. Bg11-27]|uniref:hypothetical protein n=1 Tax=Olleya sp. Bg11-27 TaxID=2058135 RepID=UPI000C315EAC|nr:hypothetical protein [Olleya sp. Bg11-27]AUC74711.1 hypothetical protein CW732_03075 [Olleya sp. Bg11-27]